MAIGKSKRFEIFARDSFTCQYCGRRPPDVVLEVDHIHPVSGCGGDDDLNLTTACFDCNRGKRAKIIGEIAPKPDADLKYLKALQEEAEIKRYLECSERIDALRDEAIDRLERVWLDLICGDYSPSEKQWHIWLTRYSPEEVEHAIRLGCGRFHYIGGSTEEQRVSRFIPYVSGILKRVREQSEDITQ